MNNNIKDTTSLVFVKGRNHIDPKKLINGSVSRGDGKYGYYGYSVVTDYIEIVPGTWTVKLFNPGLYKIFRVVGYDENKDYLWDDSNIEVTERQFTVTTTKYVRICFEYDNYNSLSPQGLMTAQPQLEQGQATTYKPYVDKQVYVKNNQGVFEAFYNEREKVIEFGTNENGNYIKYANGICIQYGKKDLTTGSTSYTSGGFTHYVAQETYDLPIPFKDYYEIFANISSANVILINLIYAEVNSDSSKFNLHFISSNANYSRTIHWFAIGRV